ncbi:MAG: FAD-dependent oxidoreductase [Betaproteobacteria bacterium]|nr:FAD-dependent oxidoreductase [Betaproteobacteria bacterium]
MPTYEATLKGSEQVAEGTMAFRFAKPAGFAFRAGQAIELALSDSLLPEAQGARHTFSLASAPYEDELVIATRMRDSAYKRALKALPDGAGIAFEGPFGSLTLHGNRARPAVFIAGGIGITPFISMVRQATRDRLPQRLLLLYSNRRPEDAAFLVELQALARQNENFALIATMTKMEKSARTWDGERGAIDEAKVKKFAAGLASPVYYLAGPPVMVDDMRQLLERVGVSEEDVRSEEFYGY